MTPPPRGPGPSPNDVEVMVTDPASLDPARTVTVSRYDEVVEALKSPALDGYSGRHSREPEIFLGKSVLFINGAEHRRRRRALNQILRGEASMSLREEVLVPALARDLEARVAHPDPDGVARADLIELASKPFAQVIATMVGFDLATPGEAEEFVRLHRDVAFYFEFPALAALAEPLKTRERATLFATRFRETRREHPALFARYDAGEIGEREIADAIGASARRELAERYYRPAVERNRDLLARFEDGHLAEDDLPRNVVMLALAHADPAFDAEPGIVLDEIMHSHINGGIATSVAALVATIERLNAWLADHAEERARRTDPAFVMAAMVETLRLDTPVPSRTRLAREDMVLCGGTRIDAGQIAVLRMDLAGRDPAVYGADADEFDPHRRLPSSVYAYGLGFGAGSHMCYGLPLVLGDGTHGGVATVLRMLYEAGMEADPEASAVRSETTAARRGHLVVSYPIRFGAMRS